MVQTQMVITIGLSVLTLIVIYGQYRIQRYRIKLDLFDKRFKVYSYIRKFILTGSKDGGTKLEIVQEFLSNIPEYEFIFDNKGEIVKYVEDLWRRGLDYSHLQEDIGNLHSYPPGSPEREQLIKKKHPHMVFFTNEYEEVKNRFSKYLQLGEVDERNFLFKFFGRTRM